MKRRLATIGLTAITALSSCAPQSRGNRQQLETEAQGQTAQLLSQCQTTNEKLIGTINDNKKLREKEEVLQGEKEELHLRTQASILGITAKIASDVNRACDGDFFYFQIMRGGTENYGIKKRHWGFIRSQTMTDQDYECIEKAIATGNADLQAELPTCETKMQNRNSEELGIAVECMY